MRESCVNLSEFEIVDFGTSKIWFSRGGLNLVREHLYDLICMCLFTVGLTTLKVTYLRAQIDLSELSMILTCPESSYYQ